MPADRGYHDYVMETLAPLGAFSSRAMFGGYGIFHEGRMFALISGAGLYFKVDASNRAAYQAAGSAQFKPMPYYELPPDVMEDAEELGGWVEAALTVARSAPPPKKRRRGH